MRKTTPIAIIAACVPFALVADPDYTYVEGSYLNIDGDLDGFGVAGSAAIHPRLHVYAQYDRAKDSPLKVNTGAVALGLNHGMTPTTDFVARLGWARAEVDVAGLGSASDDGVAAQVGVRSMLSDSFEVNGFVNHADVAGADTTLSVGGVYGFTPALGVTGAVEFDDDDTAYRVGLRYSFGS